MKYSAITSFLPAAFAAPIGGRDTDVQLPRGWIAVNAFEVARMMASSPADNIFSKRFPGSVYMCTEAEWAGECARVTVPISYTCQDIPAPFTYNLGSIGPDRGALCRITTVSSQSSCDAHGDIFVEFPGIRNLFSFKEQNYGKDAHHIECQECTACQGED
ncbi:hypothetical protein D7B24_002171 [Verticillium nonalfalfae]|uniref:Uncharacterized protein n=1 Tax=Verticillium nonalfalfae TaxID=1051616 RepID=A0A3M9YI18_9PEZI|nr:uncharacterized protein D7B24_002171 [Verticillium nonalfalfae]RNJ59562.1 hypothetical protein D7B24_002171 [Verticillium nonalfalfae]